MSQMDVSVVIEDVLGRSDRVLLAYLFGSRATDRSGPRSDVDVAVLLSGNRAERRQTLGELMDALVRALGRDDIDLIDLDEAPIPLRYRVVRDGRVLRSTHEGIRQRFETQTIMLYLDFKPVRDQAFKTAHEAIMGAG